VTAVPGTDEVTARIAEIWTAALGVPVSTADHDFFACGGDSFQAALATAQVRREWGLEITVRLLTDHPVMGDFAAQVNRLVAGR
jgi:hypothetical protein